VSRRLCRLQLSYAGPRAVQSLIQDRSTTSDYPCYCPEVPPSLACTFFSSRILIHHLMKYLYPALLTPILARWPRVGCNKSQLAAVLGATSAWAGPTPDWSGSILYLVTLEAECSARSPLWRMLIKLRFDIPCAGL
jgi:hypothetical protein